MKFKYNILALVLFLFMGNACSDFLDVQPKDKQTDKQLYATKGGFYAASNGTYNKLTSSSLYGKTLTYEMIDVLSKRYAPQTNNTYLTALDTWNYADTQVESRISATWSTAFNTIMNCNFVLDNIEKQDGILTEKEAKIMRGEMLAMRAFLHFDMLRLFGPMLEISDEDISIPYNESTTVQVLELLPAKTVLNEKILKDLEEAEALLKGNDPVITEGPLAFMPEDKDGLQLHYRQMRFNYYSVLALKARVYLYAKDKEKALAAAKVLLDDPTVHTHFPAVDPNKLLANSTTPDRLFSTESFMGMYVKTMKDIFTYNFDPDNSRTNLLKPRANFVTTQLFQGETADYRYQSQWQQSTSVGVSGEVLVKYKGIIDENNKLFYGTFFPLIRLSELYLIAAESESDISDGAVWLNKFRATRGVPDKTIASEAELMTALRLEYLKEFHGEGQIFYMYKRMNVNIVSAENGYNTSTYGTNAARFVVPVPASEIENR